MWVNSGFTYHVVLEQGYWGWMLLWPILGAFMIVLGEEKWIKMKKEIRKFKELIKPSRRKEEIRRLGALLSNIKTLKAADEIIETLIVFNDLNLLKDIMVSLSQVEKGQVTKFEYAFEAENDTKM